MFQCEAGIDAVSCRASTDTPLAGIELDFHWFPVILQRWPDGKVADADLEGFIRQLDDASRRAKQRNTYFAAIVRGKADVDAAQRRRIGRWVRDMPRDLRERSVGSFIVISGPMQRGIVTALRWIIPELKDVHPIESFEAAVEAALAALRARGVAAPGTVDEIVRYATGGPSSAGQGGVSG